MDFTEFKWAFLLISILIFNTIAFKMRKRLPLTVIYSTVFFALCVQQYFDTYATFYFKTWGFFEMGKADFYSLLVKWGIYPAASIIILNWYPFHSSLWKKSLYILALTVFSTCFEWMALEMDILWHNNWNMFYSFAIYPIIYYLFLILHARFFLWLKKRESG